MSATGVSRQAAVVWRRRALNKGDDVSTHRPRMKGSRERSWKASPRSKEPDRELVRFLLLVALEVTRWLTGHG